MAAHSPVAAVQVPVNLHEQQGNWWAWLEHIALAVTQLMAWTNQPRLVAQTVATLPSPAYPGMLAYVTDSTVGAGIPVGGGTTKCLVWYNGTSWRVVAT